MDIELDVSMQSEDIMNFCSEGCHVCHCNSPTGCPSSRLVPTLHCPISDPPPATHLLIPASATSTVVQNTCAGRMWGSLVDWSWNCRDASVSCCRAGDVCAHMAMISICSNLPATIMMTMPCEMHRRHAARCHFAAFRECTSRATMMGSTILEFRRGSRYARTGVGSLARLGWTLRARELTTFWLHAFSLVSCGFMLRRLQATDIRHACKCCSGGARAALMCREADPRHAL